MSKKSEMNDKLYGKLEAEYNGFIDNLKTLPPEEIISKSYEKIFKEDILACFGETQLDYDEAQALYSLENPLTTMYDDWLNMNSSYMDMLRDSIDDSIKSAMEFVKEKPSVLDKLEKAKKQQLPKAMDKAKKAPDKEVR